MKICIDYRIWLYIKYRMCFATVDNNQKLTKADVYMYRTQAAVSISLYTIKLQAICF